METKKYYVYILFDGKIPFYVGKGTKKRMYEHHRLAKQNKIKSPVICKIKNMIENGRNVIYEKVFLTDDVNLALLKEIELIKQIGRKDLNNGPLCNLTDGGEGVVNYRFTEEHKKNLSDSIKKAIEEGRYLPEGGKYIRTDKNKEEMSNSLKEYWQTSKSDLHKAKIREFALTRKGKKRILSEEARRKMSEGAKKSNLQRKNKHNID